VLACRSLKSLAGRVDRGWSARLSGVGAGVGEDYVQMWVGRGHGIDVDGGWYACDAE